MAGPACKVSVDEQDGWAVEVLGSRLGVFPKPGWVWANGREDCGISWEDKELWVLEQAGHQGSGGVGHTEASSLWAGGLAVREQQEGVILLAAVAAGHACSCRNSRARCWGPQHSVAALQCRSPRISQQSAVSTCSSSVSAGTCVLVQSRIPTWGSGSMAPVIISS